MARIFTIDEFRAICDAYPGEPHGAYPAGTKIVKIKGEPGDVHSLGVRGVVIQSAYNPKLGQIGYLVRWQHGTMGLIIGDKITCVSE